MEWRQTEGMEWLEADLPGGRVAFSTRSAGSAKESHAPFAKALGLDPSRVAINQQVHGAELSYGEAALTGTPEADGHVIAAPGIAGLVYAADCLPVAVSGPGGVAMLHCGWRGLAAGIVGQGAAAVEATHAAIGPGIGPCCYEVGDEVLAAFETVGERVAADRTLDLPEVARRLLRQAGVEEIDSTELCTCCEEELFFSHRRDGGPGRQAGVAWLDGAG
jgi:YfiH family protein